MRQIWCLRRRSHRLLLLVAILVGATASAATTPEPVRGGALSRDAGGGVSTPTGRWSGIVTQGGFKFRLALVLRSGPAGTPGRVEIASQGCVGKVVYRSRDGARFVYSMSWQRGGCLSGTMWLRVVGANELAYSWAGAGLKSAGRLRRQ